jgi:acyl-CoA reductase-like NAD-dependent aldehyde dehydrogenase
VAGPLAAPFDLYIDGRWRRPDAGRFDDVCPTTEQVIAEVPDASVDQVAEAVGAARRTFDAGGWSEADPGFRASCLSQLGDALAAAREDLVALSRVEWASTAPEDRLQIDAPAFMALGGAQLATSPDEEVVEALGAPGRVLLRHEPVGVVSVLTPWNFPHTLNVMKLAPALAAGNTVVLKPSPLAPLAGLALARLIDEHTGLPPGVVNVVTTTSLEASRALVTDPRVDMVSFTGSTATGRSIMAQAAGTLKRLLLELGGKSATVLLDGVDLDAVLPGLLVDGCTLHAGQACILRSRLVVHRSVHDEVVERLAALAAGVVVGDPVDPGVEMGPLVSDAQCRRVEELVSAAVGEGARLAAGGRRPPGRATGHFFEPTVLGGVASGSAIAQTEVFGPVLCVLPYDDVDEAVRIANDSTYGLVGSVYGADVDQALAVARRIRTGQVAVNGHGPGDSPFGGYKQSGLGREGGLVGLHQYTETKVIGAPA